MRSASAWLAIGLITWALALSPALAGMATFWPALAAVAIILLTRNAIAGLATGVACGAVILAGGRPLEAVRLAFADHLLPSLDGRWHVGALIFTLLLGGFAGILEKSGGFTRLLEKLAPASTSSAQPPRRILLATYLLGLLCFFDGLANSMLVGRVARQPVDHAGISREKLAWIVDSTSSPVACVAFISTWIATQLTLIQASLPEADPYALFFASVPANPYCVLTLLLVPLAIVTRWEPRAMRRYRPRPVEIDARPVAAAAPWRVLLPIATLAVAIAFSLQLWSGQPLDLLSLEAWRLAASSPSGPTALIAGALAGLAAAWLCFPKARRDEAGPAALHGASSLLPALVVLILAWALGSTFTALGAAERLKLLLGENLAPAWLPLAVFATGSLTSFATGSSWGTMALLMPLALGLLPAGGESLAPLVIGAVFGGAVFGDHCSPFSDTTIVSAIAAGCRPVEHVLSQLPYALATAAFAAAAYALAALGWHAALATAAAAVALAGLVGFLARAPKPHC